MDDKKLFELQKDAVKAGLKLLKSLYEDRKYSKFWILSEPEFLTDGSYSKMKIVIKPLVYKVQHLLKKEKAVAKLCQYIAGSNLSTQLVANNAADSADDQVFLWLFLPFLDYYLVDVDQLDFNDSVFQRTYDGMAQYFDAREVTILFIAPLLGFDTDSTVKGICLDSAVSIDRISINLRKQLWYNSPIRRSISTADISNLKYQATFRQNVPKENPLSYREDIYKDMESLQALLRLIKQDPITIMCVIMSYSPWYLGPYTDIMPEFDPWPTIDPVVGRDYSFGSSQGSVFAQPFSAEDVVSLKMFWNNLITMDARSDTSRVILALRRFSSLYDRSTSEDKLLDLWIALELLYPETGKGYSKQRLGAITKFLNIHKSQRRYTHRVLDNSYELRSDIVHGWSYRHKFRDVLPLTQKIIVNSLLKCLWHGVWPDSTFMTLINNLARVLQVRIRQLEKKNMTDTP